MNNLLEAEKAAVKLVETELLRTELLRRAAVILKHGRGGFVLSANDLKTAWASLCRSAGPMKTRLKMLRAGTGSDSDDASYLYDSENDDVSVDESQNRDSDGPESNRNRTEK